jgi:RecA/RadA recombinase
MALQDLLDLTRKQFEKKHPGSLVDFRLASQEPPPTGLIVDNPLLEYLLDRRFLAYGRFVLAYGKKGSSKTSLFYDLAKLFQRSGGHVIWIETEHAIDLDYAAKQGVDLTQMAVLHPRSLEEGLELAENVIRNMPKAFPDGDVPVLVCFDSVAGATSEYELDQSHTINDMQPGTHARLLGRFYREMGRPLAQEKCVFLVLNQLKSKIGAFGFGEDVGDALIGGEAQFFHSTLHFKMSKVSELVDKEGADGPARKIGSVHRIRCVRNKLGRENKGQEVDVDLYINGGLDWWSPLVRKLAKEYPKLVSRAGGHYYWLVPDCPVVGLPAGAPATIDPDQAYRESELGLLIRASPKAKDAIRDAFGIPPMPPPAEVEKEDQARKKRRKKAVEAAPPEPARSLSVQ